MSKKIDLLFFIRKNRISLENFCNINNIKTYEELRKYCEQKKLICVKESFYYEIFPPKINNKPQKKTSIKKNVKQNAEKKTTKTRRTSRTRKVGKDRPAAKKDDV